MTDADGSGPVSTVEDHFAYCEAQLKAGDRTAWIATLFAPAERRSALHAIGAFALEVRGVRDKVREPLAGELRLQWWTDAIEGETRGDVHGHPIAAALLDTVRRYGLSRSALTGFIDSERDDLYDESIPTLDAFDTRADRTEGALIAQRALVLTGSDSGTTADAALHAGRAIAVVDAIRALETKRTQVLVPLDMLRRQEVGTADVKIGRSSPPVLAAIAGLAAHATAELNALRALRLLIEPEIAPALLTANVVEPILRRVARRGFDPFVTRADLPQWRKQWILWRAAGRRGVL